VRLRLAFCSIGEAIGASLNNSRNTFTKTIVNVFETRLSTLIFNAVVQKRRNG
jgi:hypothetical protein